MPSIINEDPKMTTANSTTWTVDSAHAEVGFAVKHLMIATVRGRFAGVAGTVQLDETNPANSKVNVEIDVRSIDTRQEQRDNHLRSPDFFDVEKYPTMHFAGKRIEGDTSGKFRLIGDLTIRGISQEVALDVTAEGRVRDPWGNDRAGFSASGKISRSAFGLTWNQLLEAGGVAVGDEVRLSLDVELVHQKAQSSVAA
jgi:polyisoprenoid-binding protein YceI